MAGNTGGNLTADERRWTQMNAKERDRIGLVTIVVLHICVYLRSSAVPSFRNRRPSFGGSEHENANVMKDPIAMALAFPFFGA